MYTYINWSENVPANNAIFYMPFKKGKSKIREQSILKNCTSRINCCSLLLFCHTFKGLKYYSVSVAFKQHGGA